jgi:hypothetical protein
MREQQRTHKFLRKEVWLIRAHGYHGNFLFLPNVPEALFMLSEDFIKILSLSLIHVRL